ncbi:hypothetical protein H4S07_004342, partial [Coemansia furcata]
MRFLLLNLNKFAETTLLTNGCLQLLKCPDLAPVCKLVHIELYVEENTDRTLQLARLNAQTLQNIFLSSNHDEDIRGLIRDPADGKHVEYPRLHTLKIKFGKSSAAMQGCTFEGAIPFPNLRYLAMDSDHPFGDDVVFRGNAATL